MRERILNLIAYFHLYDLILFVAFVLIAMCFVFLSFISFRKKLISIPLFLLGFCMIIAIPFAMRYFMEERFYKIEQDVAYDRTYNYSDVYQYIATITNVGKRNIAGCVFLHQILYDTDNEQGITKYKHVILNYVKPKKVYTREIPMDLKVGQSIDISEVMEGYAHKGEKYITKIECHGKRKYSENTKVLNGFYKNASEEQIPKGKDFKKAPDDAGKDDMNAYTETIKQLELTTMNKSIESQIQKINAENNVKSLQDVDAQYTESINSESDNSDTEILPEIKAPQSQGMPTPQEEQLAPNWREERDKFNPPLLKEMPR